MAMDDQGNIIDPYNGQQDLKDKFLRHVFTAFVEDPLRV
jgi:tRNA nucleotidyltransferase (CCA-adding enzyme)